MRRKQESNTFKNKRIYVLVFLSILSYFVYKGIQTFRSSLFISHPDRINLVVYGSDTHFYSLDIKNKRHYQMSFPPDLHVDVPGGYGSYRVGSLGKLAKLDSNPDLLRKSFAATTTTFIHYYFYPETEEVYYGEGAIDQPESPSVSTFLFSAGNASSLDRLYLALQTVGAKDSNFNLIRYQEDTNDVLGDVTFRGKSFIKESRGLLYQDVYRNEQQSIQVIYPENYKTAERISALLEGNGIRVSDISLDIDRSDSCAVVHSQDTASHTAIDISGYFGCPLKNGETDVYDITFVLGNIEEEWKIL